MSTEQIQQNILNILGRITGESDFSSLDPGDDLRDALDIDSMDFYNLVLGISEEMGVDIPEDKYGQLTTLEALTAFVAGGK